MSVIECRHCKGIGWVCSRCARPTRNRQKCGSCGCRKIECALRFNHIETEWRCDLCLGVTPGGHPHLQSVEVGNSYIWACDPCRSAITEAVSVATDMAIGKRAGVGYTGFRAERQPLFVFRLEAFDHFAHGASPGEHLGGSRRLRIEPTLCVTVTPFGPAFAVIFNLSELAGVKVMLAENQRYSPFFEALRAAGANVGLPLAIVDTSNAAGDSALTAALHGWQGHFQRGYDSAAARLRGHELHQSIHDEMNQGLQQTERDNNARFAADTWAPPGARHHTYTVAPSVLAGLTADGLVDEMGRLRGGEAAFVEALNELRPTLIRQLPDDAPGETPAPSPVLPDESQSE